MHRIREKARDEHVVRGNQRKRKRRQLERIAFDTRFHQLAKAGVCSASDPGTVKPHNSASRNHIFSHLRCICDRCLIEHRTVRPDFFIAASLAGAVIAIESWPYQCPDFFCFVQISSFDILLSTAP
jgi:hypothetical protein